MSREILLEVKNISKSFGATKAVSNMSLTLYRGEIRGLIGENGSGKSTLTSMIAGCLKPDGGELILNGKPFSPKSMLQGRAGGVCMLLQEKGTINGLTIAENIFLGKTEQFRRCGVVNRKAMNAEAQKVLQSIDLTETIASHYIDELNFEDRKLVEVGMAMKEDPELLIVDETTTALSQKGREVIYRTIREMKERQKSVIFISHDLDELMAVADSVTVMRDGEFVTTLEKNELSVDRLRSSMIGRDLSGRYYRTDFDTSCEQNAVVLEFKDVCYENVVKNASLQLHRGEILGVGGLTNSGMHEMCKLAYGLYPPDSGRVWMPEKKREVRDPAQAVKMGLGYVPKDRELEGLMLAGSIQDNLCIMAMDRVRRGNLITPSAMRRLSEQQVDALSIKIGGLRLPTSSLSGGNKQKVVIGKNLANQADVLIMDCPTRGIDIGVKAAIYRLLEELKGEGKAILMVSEELPELLGMADRILIMKDGAITANVQRQPGLTEHDLIKLMI